MAEIGSMETRVPKEKYDIIFMGTKNEEIERVDYLGQKLVLCFGLSSRALRSVGVQVVFGEGGGSERGTEGMRWEGQAVGGWWR